MKRTFGPLLWNCGRTWQMPCMYHKAECQRTGDTCFGRLDAYAIAVLSVLMIPSCLTAKTGSSFPHKPPSKEETSQAASPRQAHISAWARGSHQWRSGCEGSRHRGRPLWGCVWHSGLVSVVKVGLVPMATRAHSVPQLPQEPVPVKQHEELNAVNKNGGKNPKIL